MRVKNLQIQPTNYFQTGGGGQAPGARAPTLDPPLTHQKLFKFHHEIGKKLLRIT